MTGLFSRGEVVNLEGEIWMEGALSVLEYTDVYYEDGTKKVTSQILVYHILDMALCTILFTIFRL